jgi:hypothetical protein
MPERRPPYESPFFSVTFYPEDASFSALVKTVRASCRTIELFEIARTVLAKPERFTVSVSPRQAEAPESQPPARPAEPAEAPVAPQPEKPASIHICVPDGLPFESEEAAIAHGLRNHLGYFFRTEEVEAEPPKGSFQVINRCSITGELLGPPNYHRYNQIMQQHFAAKIGRMSLEEYRSRIESVRDPLVIQQWLDKMKKVTRYTWRLPGEGSPPPSKAEAAAASPGAPTPVPEVQAEPEPGDAGKAPEGQDVPEGVSTDAPAASSPGDAGGAEAGARETPPAGEPPKPADPVSTAPTFDSLEDARVYLLTQARGKLVRQLGTVRIHGRALDALPQGEVRRAIEGEYERQTRFPLDTANALRGRLRREHFTIFKKGAKGVSYVCAVKRKFRVPGQTFSESIGNLISFVEAHPMIRAGELLRQYLGLPPSGDRGAAEGTEAAQELTAEQREKMLRVQADVLWLVREGYVTEFIDGSLYASPPVGDARRKEVEAGEADPENFPEVRDVQESVPAEPPPPGAAPQETAVAPVESTVAPTEDAAVPPGSAVAPVADVSPPEESAPPPV